MFEASIKNLNQTIKKKEERKKRTKKKENKVEIINGNMHPVAWTEGHMWCPGGRLGWGGGQR